MDFLEFFATDWGLLRFVAGFVILPLLYLRESIEVHKLLAELFETIGAADSLREHVSEGDIAELEAKLHVFDLDWWLVGAVTALLIGVFLLGDLARFSDLLTDEQRNGTAIRGGLNTFGLAVALIYVACVEWAKFDAHRMVQRFWRLRAIPPISP